MVKYRFIRCAPNKKYPNLQGWYLVLTYNNRTQLEKLHKGIANLYYRKFGMDPHYSKPDINWLYNPIKLAAKWFETVLSTLASGEVLAVNSSGGWLPLAGIKILEKIESDELRWPDRFPGEIITISRWPDGRHYYLTSNRERIFYPTKFYSIARAEQEARKYTDNIREKL